MSKEAEDFLEQRGYGSPATSISLSACEDIMQAYADQEVKKALKEERERLLDLVEDEMPGRDWKWVFNQNSKR